MWRRLAFPRKNSKQTREAGFGKTLTRYRNIFRKNKNVLCPTAAFCAAFGLHRPPVVYPARPYSLATATTTVCVFFLFPVFPSAALAVAPGTIITVVMLVKGCVVRYYCHYFLYLLVHTKKYRFS